MKKKISSICTLLACIAAFAACGNDDGDAGSAGWVNVKNVYTTGCKTTETANASQKTRSFFEDMGYKEYVEYTSKDNGYVHVTHHNALFNCCSDVIDVDVSQGLGSIIVTETENNYAICNCICPFDVSFELGPMEMGHEYNVVIKSGGTDGVSFSFTYPSSGKVEVRE